MRLSGTSGTRHAFENRGQERVRRSLDRLGDRSHVTIPKTKSVLVTERKNLENKDTKDKSEEVYIRYMI